VTRIIVDLPDAIYQQLRSLASKRGTTTTQILRGVVEREVVAAARTRQRRRVKVPILKSKQPRTLNLTNSEIEDLLT
jgi:uncharacterized caspase-like protein